MKKVHGAMPCMFILMLIVPILPSFGDQSNGNNENGSIDPLGVPNIVAVILIAPIGGLVVYLLKRSFVNHDFEFQKKVEHENWLYQQFKPLASDHYVPIGKFAYDAMESMVKATVVLSNEQSIQIAYFHMCIFLSRYVDFKNAIGANFLFKTRKFEEEAIFTMSAILSSLPFSDLDIVDIHKNMANDDKKVSMQFTSYEYQIFRNWLTLDQCKLSVDLVIKKLDYLQRILDTGGEEISHPDLFDADIANKIIPPVPEDDIFFILSCNTKYAKRGEIIAVIGEDFRDFPYRISFQFFLGTRTLEVVDRKKRLIRLKIPDDMPDGTYDVFATFRVNRFGRVDSETTIGLPITVSD